MSWPCRTPCAPRRPAPPAPATSRWRRVVAAAAPGRGARGPREGDRGRAPRGRHRPGRRAGFHGAPLGQLTLDGAEQTLVLRLGTPPSSVDTLQAPPVAPGF